MNPSYSRYGAGSAGPSVSRGHPRGPFGNWSGGAQTVHRATDPGYRTIPNTISGESFTFNYTITIPIMTEARSDDSWRSLKYPMWEGYLGDSLISASKAYDNKLAIPVGEYFPRNRFALAVSANSRNPILSPLIFELNRYQNYEICGESVAVTLQSINTVNSPNMLVMILRNANRDIRTFNINDQISSKDAKVLNSSTPEVVFNYGTGGKTTVLTNDYTALGSPDSYATRTHGAFNELEDAFVIYWAPIQAQSHMLQTEEHSQIATLVVTFCVRCTTPVITVAQIRFTHWAAAGYPVTDEEGRPIQALGRAANTTIQPQQPTGDDLEKPLFTVGPETRYRGTRLFGGMLQLNVKPQRAMPQMMRNIHMQRAREFAAKCGLLRADDPSNQSPSPVYLFGSPTIGADEEASVLSITGDFMKETYLDLESGTSNRLRNYAIYSMSDTDGVNALDDHGFYVFSPNYGLNSKHQLPGGTRHVVSPNRGFRISPEHDISMMGIATDIGDDNYLARPNRTDLWYIPTRRLRTNGELAPFSHGATFSIFYQMIIANSPGLVPDVDEVPTMVTGFNYGTDLAANTTEEVVTGETDFLSRGFGAKFGPHPITYKNIDVPKDMLAMNLDQKVLDSYITSIRMKKNSVLHAIATVSKAGFVIASAFSKPSKRNPAGRLSPVVAQSSAGNQPETLSKVRATGRGIRPGVLGDPDPDNDTLTTAGVERGIFFSKLRIPENFEGPELRTDRPINPVIDLAFGNFTSAMRYTIGEVVPGRNHYQVAVDADLMIDPEITAIVSTPLQWIPVSGTYTGTTDTIATAYVEPTGTSTSESHKQQAYERLAPTMQFGVYTGVACSLYNPQEDPDAISFSVFLNNPELNFSQQANSMPNKPACNPYIHMRYRTTGGGHHDTYVPTFTVPINTYMQTGIHSTFFVPKHLPQREGGLRELVPGRDSVFVFIVFTAITEIVQSNRMQRITRLREMNTFMEGYEKRSFNSTTVHETTVLESGATYGQLMGFSFGADYFMEGTAGLGGHRTGEALREAMSCESRTLGINANQPVMNDEAEIEGFQREKLKKGEKIKK
jgi:hypothetical protein